MLSPPSLHGRTAAGAEVQPLEKQGVPSSQGPGSLTLPPGRMASFGTEPWEWWGKWGPVARHCTETGYPQQSRWDLPRLLPTPGVWLLASQGPYVGTVMWPQAERSHSLFAEGRKTTHGLLIQPHLGAPGSAASVCPDCPARITQGWWGLVGVARARGLLGASRPRPRPGRDSAGRPQRSPGNSKKEPGPLTLMMAEGLGHSGRGRHCDPLFSAPKAPIPPRVSHFFFPGAVCLCK